MSDLERIEAAMEEKVRPALRSHGGDISIDHVEGKTVYVKLLGQCAGCPSADLTNETIVEAELKAALPEVEIRVDSQCCAGVTEESHQAALATMRSCQVVVE